MTESKINNAISDVLDLKGTMDFYRSLDACAVFEKSLSLTEEEEYSKFLFHVTDGERKFEVMPYNWFVVFQNVTALPPQRCEAFLKLKGFWIQTGSTY